VWEGSDRDGFLEHAQRIGLVLEAELVEMDGESGLFEPTQEWMYRVSLSDGTITEVWDYEIKPVNAMSKEYNTLSHQPEGD